MQNALILCIKQNLKLKKKAKKWSLKKIFPRFRDFSTKLVLNHSPLNTDFA